MRVLLLAFCAVATLGMLANISCNNCPTTGGANGSLYCHSLECAANESECNGACANTQYDSQNCGGCGKVCGDGLACSQGSCVEACPDPTQTRCNGVCLDLTTDPNNCGACSTGCTNGNTCASSSCTCVGVQCAGQCIDPMTNNTYCGASAGCAGSSSGQQCDTSRNELCNQGTCRSDLIYRGSLPPINGVWNLGGTLGLAGANAVCQSKFANTNNANDHVGVCTYAQLQQASTTNPPETINATDFNGTAVSQWWIDDPAATTDLRCSDQCAHNDTPWTYATAHLGNVGKFAQLTPATGAVSAVVVGTPNAGRNNTTCCTAGCSVPIGSQALCNVARSIPCCTQ